jgi:hypothetical protein
MVDLGKFCHCGSVGEPLVEDQSCCAKVGGRAILCDRGLKNVGGLLLSGALFLRQVVCLSCRKLQGFGMVPSGEGNRPGRSAFRTFATWVSKSLSGRNG